MRRKGAGVARRVLVVDDSAFARGLTVAFLRAIWSEAEVIEAADPQDALERCAAAPPDHIIADMNMPGMSGLDMIEILRARGVAATATLITADRQEVVRRRAEAAKARFIDKPITKDKMRRLLEELEGGLLAYLDPEARDAFCEIFNVGAGRAAQGLSDMLGREIRFTVPGLLVLGVNAASAYIEDQLEADICVVREGFSGPFSGEALLMLARPSALRLIEVLLPDQGPRAVFDALAEDALSEVGNLVLNACLASFAHFLQTEIEKTLPELLHTTPDGVRGLGARFGVVVMIRVVFSVEGHGIEGLTSFLLGLESMDALRRATDRMLRRLAVG